VVDSPALPWNRLLIGSGDSRNRRIVATPVSSSPKALFLRVFSIGARTSGILLRMMGGSGPVCPAPGLFATRPRELCLLSLEFSCQGSSLGSSVSTVGFAMRHVRFSITNIRAGAAVDRLFWRCPPPHPWMRSKCVVFATEPESQGYLPMQM
jgi:hypothetical protein